MLQAIRRTLGLTPLSTLDTSEDREGAFADALTMLRIRKNDCRELEELYRQFVLPQLAPRTGRDDDLFGLIGTTVGEGLYICDRLQRSLAAAQGDICEFGVAQGATSRLLAREILASPHGDSRSLWLFDSFEGLPKPSEKDVLIDDIFGLGSMERYTGTMSCPRELVEAKLREAGFPAERTVVKEGWVSASLATAPLPARVAFAYVDFDFYEPIRDALEWLDQRMDAGTSIVVDDYGFFSEGAQAAVDEFVAAHSARWRFELPVPAAGKFCVVTRT